MIEIKEIIVILAGYALGCFTTGYYWVRYRTGRDIRDYGSAAVGARNVGREFGATGFAVTFFGDFAKGVLTVSVASYLEFNLAHLLLAMHAVVIGHVWPVQLAFRGGKGIATAYGALVVLDPILAAGSALIALAGFALSRRLTLSGLIAVSLSPAIAAALNRPPTLVLGLATLAIVILIAHRNNLQGLGNAIKRNTRTSDRFG